MRTLPQNAPQIALPADLPPGAAVSDLNGLTGLPRYDAALAAIDAAIAQARLELARDDLTLDECIEIWRAFAFAERSMYAIRLRGEKRGLRVFREMRRA